MKTYLPGFTTWRGRPLLQGVDVRFELMYPSGGASLDRVVKAAVQGPSFRVDLIPARAISLRDLDINPLGLGGLGPQLRKVLSRIAGFTVELGKDETFLLKASFVEGLGDEGLSWYYRPDLGQPGRNLILADDQPSNEPRTFAEVYRVLIEA